MKKISKRRTYAILLSLAAMAAWPLNAGATEVKDSGYIKLEFYNEGETYESADESITSTYTLNDNQKEGIAEASKYWGNLLKVGQGDKTFLLPVLTNNDNNAYCAARLVSYSDNIAMTDLEAFYKGYSVPNQDVEIIIGKAYFPATMAEQEHYIPAWQSGGASVYGTMIHEIAHGLGITLPPAEVGADNKMHFSDASYAYRDSLYDWRGVQATAGMKIDWQEYKTNVTADNETFSLVSNTEAPASNFATPYFAGSHVQSLLDGAKLQVYNSNGLAMEQWVSGVPINGVEGAPEEGETVADKIDLSHLELRNGLMSHQDYRNYATFMEGELAVLQDIGYNIDVRSLFGKSVYGDGLTLINNNGFSARNDSGTAYLENTPSQVSYGTGLHIYGSKNNITQAADILNAGAAGVGVRIDGVENTITIDSGTKITGDGYNGVGIWTAYGKNHELNLEQGSTVTALGTNGVGLLFDFGQNIMGSNSASRASYGAKLDGAMYEAGAYEVDGALANEVNINGTVEGQGAAIKMSANAFVENLNIGTGAKLQGDIINNWAYDNEDIRFPKNTIMTDEEENTTDVSGLIDSAMYRQYTGDRDYITELNFTGTDLNYDGAITGAKNTRLNITGSLNYTGDARVLSVEVAEGAALSGHGTYYLLYGGVDHSLNYNTWTYDGTATHGTEINRTLANVGLFTNKGTVATLNGDMTINGDLVSSGRLNLNGGDLRISGNFENSGRIGLAVEKGQLMGEIKVGGTATVTGEPFLTNGNFAPLFDTKYTYLSAEDGLTGATAYTYALNDYVKLSATADENSLSFTAAQTASLAQVAVEKNNLTGLEKPLDNWTNALYAREDLDEGETVQRADLTALYYGNTATRLMKEVKTVGRTGVSLERTNPLTLLANMKLMARLNSYSVENPVAVSSVTALTEPSREVLEGLQTTIPVAMDAKDNFWGSMFRGQANRDAGSVNSNTFGGLLGYDHSLNLTDRLGGFASYGKTSYGGDNSNANSHDWRVGMYGSHINGDWTYQGVLSYGANRYDTKHYVLEDTYTGKYDMKVWDVTAKAIYNVPSARTKTWQVMPYGQLEYTRGARAGYTEQGGTFAQQHEGKSYNTATAELGLELKRSLGKNGHWGGSLGYKRILSGASAELQSSFAGSAGLVDTGFTLSQREDKDYLTYSLKADSGIGGRWTLEGMVQGERSAHNHNELYSLTAKYSF